MMSSPSSPTVGDETRLARPGLWVVAVFLPCLVVGSTAAFVYAFYKDLPAIAPWRALAIALGGVPPALVTVVFGIMHLFQALVNVGFYCLAVPLWWAGALVACLVAILVAGVIAFWVCLARV
jgi:hypothetical protein